MNTIKHLINYFKPDNYQLNLTIDKKNRQFSGQVIITGQPLSDKVYLHAKDLEIKSVTTDEQTHPTWQLNDDELAIDTQATSITVSFAGHINETAMNGLYLCKYRLDGQDKELFATQFESHYARQCFPCIDEPEAKATFDVSITSTDPDDSIILSNMPGHKDGDTWTFDTTPRMSTYLLAFVGGRLISRSGKTNRGVEVSTYATPAQPIESLDYALDTAIKSIEFYEDYFGIDYPLPKLDNVALPDFSAGAMENWGLITYRETAMLVTENTAEASRESISTVITHEISHQWFGNLVTMKWWNDLWLNESFASLMEHTAVDHIYPQYHIWDGFETSDVSSALKRDAVPGVQSVQQEVKSPDEIATLFDSSIVYAKGERLLKMLRSIIGESNFRAALTDYFKQHQYSNTVADDLWQALSKNSDLDVKALMNPWLTRPGYPIITASLNGDTLTLTQTEFLTNGEPDQDKIWPIPLFSNVAELPEIMDQKELVVELADPNQLIHLNIDNQAHFIVSYDDAMLARLAKSFDELSTTDKVKLLRESILLSLSGQRDISQAVRLLKGAQHETSQAVLATMSSLINYLDMLIDKDNTDGQRKLDKFTCQLFSEQFTHLFGESTTGQLTLNEQKSLGVVLVRNALGGNLAAIGYCQQQYNNYRDNLSLMPGDIRAAVLQSVIKNGNDDTFSYLKEVYATTQDADLRMDICAGLTACTKQRQIQQLLSDALNTKLVKPQETVYFIAWLLLNKDGREMTWQWIQSNWSWIEEIFGGDKSYDDYIRIAGNNLNSDKQLTEFDAFFTPISHDNPALVRSIKMGHECIVNKINWIKHNQSALLQLLD